MVTREHPKDKRCPHCEQTKPTVAFGLLHRGGTRLQAWCKECLRNRPRVELLEFTCDTCNQLCKRRATAPGKKVRGRTTCWLCSRRAKLAANGGHSLNYSGTKYFAGRTIYGWKFSAARRGHEWAVTNEQLDEQYGRQSGICALSGLKMGGGSKSRYRPSIDRIDSTKGYTADNIQFVCSVVNVMKNKISEPEFIRLCGLIAKHRGE